MLQRTRMLPFAEASALPVSGIAQVSSQESVLKENEAVYCRQDRREKLFTHLVVPARGAACRRPPPREKPTHCLGVTQCSNLQSGERHGREVASASQPSLEHVQLHICSRRSPERKQHSTVITLPLHE